MSTCSICNKEINQLQGRNRTRCNSCNTRVRRHRTKIKAVALLGGECNRCGYKENIVALEFHHKDASKKEFAIGAAANKSWNSIEEEILKCELLCSNCHRIEHSNRDDAIFLSFV